MDTAQRDLEHTLAYHGAPALAGIKPADLIAWGTPQTCTSPFFQEYCTQLALRGIQLRVMCTGRPRCLLLVYRPDQLERQLADGAVRALLLREGYPVDQGLEAMLTALGRRLSEGSFPHEVGLFLGYPAADVEGFRRNGGRNCKLCGHWKVYGQVEEAQRRFLAFDRCREALCRWVAEGRSLEQLFPAV